MCLQFQEVNEVNFKSLANVFLAFKKNAWLSKWIRYLEFFFTQVCPT